jgi:uncharacterized protein (DUF58 family)
MDVPPVVRFQRGQSGELLLVILRSSSATLRARLLIGLPFPKEVGAAADVRRTEFAPGAEAARAVFACTPARRGLYRIETAFVQTLTPLRLWEARSSLPCKMDIRVYPDLRRDRQRVSSIFLRRRMAGQRSVRVVGQGRDFEKLREYLTGDPVSDIHWRATAKRAKPVTKVYQAEQTQEVYVIIDASRLMGRAAEDAEAPGDTVLERFVGTSLIVALAAEQQGDQFGMITFDSQVRSFIRAGSGKVHFDACRDRIYTLQPALVAPDFLEVCTHIRQHLRKRALLVFLTALDDPALAETFERGIDLLVRQHLIFVHMIRPFGSVPLFSGVVPENLNDAYHQLAGHLTWRDLRELEKSLQRKGVRLTQSQATDLTARIVKQLGDAKDRQLL